MEQHLGKICLGWNWIGFMVVKLVAALFLPVIGFSQAGQSSVVQAPTKPTLNCDFGKYSNWKQFLSFDGKPTKYLEAKKDDSELARFELHKVGKVTEGTCKGAEVFIGRAVSTDCGGKSSPSPMYVFAADFESDEDYKGSEGSGSEGYCGTDFRVIKRGNSFFGNYPDDEELDQLLKVVKPNESFIYDKSAEYKEYAFGKTLTFEHQPTKAKFSFANTNRSPTLITDRFFAKYEKIASDPIFGNLYLSGRSTLVEFPDHTYDYFQSELQVSRPKYWYLGYLTGVEALLGLKEKDLSQIKGESGWLEISDRTHSSLTKLYSAYTKRVKAVKARQDSSDSFEKIEVKTLPFAEFAAVRPVLFFKDKLGKVQVFKKLMHEIPSLAEPLLYIYSDSPKTLKIQLCEHLRIKATRPAYKNGWNVLTQKDGSLTDLKTGRRHRYLFWEGFAGHIPPYERGWVVAQSELSNLFDRILPAHGLNEVEIADFKNYWVPALNRAPYYQIEILPQSWVDTICPVTITPKPNEFLRVHMRAYELLQPRSIEPPSPPPPFQRTDFTAVEWSGFVN